MLTLPSSLYTVAHAYGLVVPHLLEQRLAVTGVGEEPGLPRLGWRERERRGHFVKYWTSV